MRFRTSVNLVNQLEAAAGASGTGRRNEELARRDLIVLDELGYLQFVLSGGLLMFYLIIVSSS